MSEFDELIALLEAAGGTAATHAQPLARYGALVLEANRQFNLTGAKSAHEFAPHVIDSVSIAPFVEGSLVDIGSGGGLPAIPLGIVTGVPVTMVETTVKKARFLERMLLEFGLAGAVIAQRAEIAAHDPALRGRFHTGTARAVSAAPTVAELLLPFLAVGGRAVLQRGALEEREANALADAALMLGARVTAVVPDALGADRRVVIVEKTGATSLRFPRRVGVPEKRPLCF